MFYNYLDFLLLLLSYLQLCWFLCKENIREFNFSFFCNFFLHFSCHLVNCLMSSCILLQISFFLILAHDSAVFPKTASSVHPPPASQSKVFIEITLQNTFLVQSLQIPSFNWHGRMQAHGIQAYSSDSLLVKIAHIKSGMSSYYLIC